MTKYEAVRLVLVGWSAALVALITISCVHRLAVVPVPVPVAVVVPVVRWMLPLDANDDTPFCIAATTDPWVNPADVLPLRCVSVGAVRSWIRAQRLADE